MRNSAYLILIVLLSVSLAEAGKAQTITTVAGGGPNGLPANKSNVNDPHGVAVDAFGNVFIATPHRIYKVKKYGQLTVYAGTGFAGTTSTGDGGPATQATFINAEDLAVDAAGNLFVTDIFDCIVRRIDAQTHVITTVAGPFVDPSSAPAAPQGIALDKQGNVLIPVSTAGKIWKLDSKTQAVTPYFAGATPSATLPPAYPATTALADALLRAPADLAVDSSGNVFIADGLNFAVYRVDASTHGISTIVQPGVLAEWNTYGMSTDEDGNLFITDHSHLQVQRWDASSQAITVAAGNGIWSFSGDGGPATQAELALPLAVAVRSNSTLYIADSGNNRIRAVDLRSDNPDQQTISTFAGNGLRGFSGDGSSATRASLFQPNAVLSDRFGNLYIADTPNNVVRRVDALSNVITTYAGNAFVPPTGDVKDGGTATSGSLQLPEGVAIDLTGNLYIADSGDARIRAVDPIFHRINTVAGTGNFAFDCLHLGVATATDLGFPSGVASDSFGNLFIADQFTLCVTRVDAFTHTISEFVPGTLPTSVARDRAGNVYITDVSVIEKVDSRGNLTIIAGSAGPPGYDGDGKLATSATLNFPMGVAVDAFGNVYIADTGNNVIRKIDARTQLIRTIAGNTAGIAGFSGDGGPAINAQLSAPSGVFVDLSGNIFIADTGNNRIRKIWAERD